jgi:hypothetical protein
LLSGKRSGPRQPRCGGISEKRCPACLRANAGEWLACLWRKPRAGAEIERNRRRKGARVPRPDTLIPVELKPGGGGFKTKNPTNGRKARRHAARGKRRKNGSAKPLCAEEKSLTAAAGSREADTRTARLRANVVGEKNKSCRREKSRQPARRGTPRTETRQRRRFRKKNQNTAVQRSTIATETESATQREN